MKAIYGPDCKGIHWASFFQPKVRFIIQAWFKIMFWLLVSSFDIIGSLNTVISGLPIGIFEPKAYNLSFLATLVTLTAFQLLGALAAGYIAARRARLGMRTMVITRYSYGS
ncbi:hypothetical protein M422DRAFT_247227 [Sphaerobolus stellatus SS14]|nr:hypothetical protein M422DRAFT_247227 [Sphaerobolus stellatus SS14]